MKTSQPSLFDEEKRYAKLTELVDPLEKVDRVQWTGKCLGKNLPRHVRKRTMRREDARP